MVYKDFKNYFSQKYYDNIERIVKKYVIENKENINTSYIPNPYKHSLEEYSVMSIQFEKGINSSDIKFYVAILAYVEITGKTSNYKNKDYDVDRAETWLSIEWSATLDNGLKNLKMLGYHDYSKKRYNEEKTLSKYLLPYVSTENLDKFAEKFFKKYYSEALEKPMPLPVFEIISKMGLNVLYGPMPDSIFGRTYFRDAQERVYNDSGVLILKSGKFTQQQFTQSNTALKRNLENQTKKLVNSAIDDIYYGIYPSIISGIIGFPF